jgi:hypothetical protein
MAGKKLIFALGRWRGLPPELILREALDRVLAESRNIPLSPSLETAPETRPIRELIVDNMADVPLGVMEAMPRDGDKRREPHPRQERGDKKRSRRFAEIRGGHTIYFFTS